MILGLSSSALLVVGILAVLIVILIVLAVKEPADGLSGESTPGRPTAVAAGSLADVVLDPGASIARYLATFVNDPAGKAVGETVHIKHDEVILKMGTKFFVVKPSQILIKDGGLVADPQIDWENAEHAGEQWRTRSTDEIQYDEKGMPVGGKAKK